MTVHAIDSNMEMYSGTTRIPEGVAEPKFAENESGDGTPRVTLSGTVEKVIPSPHSSEQAPITCTAKFAFPTNPPRPNRRNQNS